MLSMICPINLKTFQGIAFILYFEYKMVCVCGDDKTSSQTFSQQNFI